MWRQNVLPRLDDILDCIILYICRTRRFKADGDVRNCFSSPSATLPQTCIRHAVGLLSRHLAVYRNV